MDFMTGWEASSSGTSTPQKQLPSSSQGDHAAGLGISSDSATSSSNTDTNNDDGTISTAKPAKPTLEQELEQMGNLVSGMSKNLGSYWGQFRRQSSTALKQSQAYAQSAAKDLTPYLDKAKAELDKLGEQAKASAAAGQAAALADGGSGGSIVNPDAPALIVPTPAENTERRESQDSDSKHKDAANESLPRQDSTNSPPLNAAAFFSRLQSQLSTNPNFQSFQSQFTAFQTDLKNRVAQSSSSGGSLDFSNIDFHEAKEKYEKAMSQGDKYFKIASKELSELLEGALKIVPPEEEAARKAAAQAVANAGGSKRKQDAAAAAAGRKETLLYRVRSDPAVMLVDPAQPPATTASTTESSSESASTPASDQLPSGAASHSDTREPFSRFLQSIKDDGGLEGGSWKGRVQAALDDADSGSVLRQTYDSIVPSKISSEVFWTRYFFRIQQIEEDEARRREILEGAAQQDDDDFSWDMEDDSLSIAEDEPESAKALSDDKGKSRELPTAASMETLKTPKPDAAPLSSGQTLASSATTDDPEESWGISPIASGQQSPVPVPARTEATTAAPEAQDIAAAAAQSSRKLSSPHQSSEEGTTSSYDVISTTSADPISTKTSPIIKKKEQAGDEDEDSDWE